MTPSPLPAKRTRVSAKRRRAAVAADLAVAVLRLSTQRQADSGLGIDAQREAVEAFVDAQGLCLDAVVEDTASATVAPAHRPGMAQMFDLTPRRTFIAWKRQSTGVNVARGLMAARNRAHAAWVEGHGPDPQGWPLPHPPVLMWMPFAATGACLRCHWVHGAKTLSVDEAALARAHARSYVDQGSRGWAVLQRPPGL